MMEICSSVTSALDPIELGVDVLGGIIPWIWGDANPFDDKMVMQQINENLEAIQKLCHSTGNQADDVLELLSKQERRMNREEQAERKKLSQLIIRRSQLAGSDTVISGSMLNAFSSLLYYLDDTIVHSSASLELVDEFGSSKVNTCFTVGGTEKAQDKMIDEFCQFVDDIRGTEKAENISGPGMTLKFTVYSGKQGCVNDSVINLLVLNMCNQILMSSSYSGDPYHVRLFDVDVGERILQKSDEDERTGPCTVTVTIQSKFPWGKEKRESPSLEMNGLDMDKDALDNFHASVESMIAQQQVKHVFLIGQTGVGKSTLGNILCGDSNAFMTSLTETGTTLPEGVKANDESCMYHKDLQVMIWDTPGLDDSEGRDEVFLKELEHILIKVQTAAAVLLCIRNPNRIPGSLKKALYMYKEIFGAQIRTVLKVVITECGANYTVEQRQKLRVAWVRNIRSALGMDIPTSCVLFLPILEAPKLPFTPTGLQIDEAHCLPIFQEHDMKIPLGLLQSPRVFKLLGSSAVLPWRPFSTQGSSTANKTATENVLRGLIVDVWLTPNVLTGMACKVFEILSKWKSATCGKDRETMVKRLQEESSEMLRHIHKSLGMGVHKRTMFQDRRIKLMTKHVTPKKRAINIATLGIVNRIRCEVVYFVPSTRELYDNIMKEYVELREAQWKSQRSFRMKKRIEKGKWIERENASDLLETTFNKLGLVIYKTNAITRLRGTTTVTEDVYEVLCPETKALENAGKQVQEIAKNLDGDEAYKYLCRNWKAYL